MVVTTPLDVNAALGLHTPYGYESCRKILRFTRQYFGRRPRAAVTDTQLIYWVVVVGGNTNTPHLAEPPAAYPPEAPIYG